MTKATAHRVEALREIGAAVERDGLLYPGELPTALSIKEMHLVVSVFQRREISGRHVEDERHIGLLRRAVGPNAASPRMLTPIVVWWGGDRWYVIDGHHRHEAYRRAGVYSPVPVMIYGGVPEHPKTLLDAVAHAAGTNSRDRLTMTKDDKVNSAWLLTALGSGSKAYVASKCSVSDGLVAEMRRVRRTLYETINPETGSNFTPDDMIAIDWKEARMAARGEEKEDATDWDPDAALRLRAEDYRKRLYDQFGNQPQRDYEAFALGLRESDKTIPAKYVQTPAWSAAIEEELDALVEERLSEILDQLAGDTRHAEAVEELRRLAATALDF